MKLPIGILIVIFSLMLFGGTSFPQKIDGNKKMQFRKNISEKLNLTDQQKDKMRELRISHKKQMIDLKADLEKSKLALQELSNNDNFTRAEVLAAVEKINHSKNQIASAAVNNKMDMYEILTPEQQKVWKKNIFKIEMYEKGRRRMHHRMGR